MDYLTEQLKDMAPHRAVLRAVECKLMGRIELRAPVLDVGVGDGHFAGIAYDRPIDVGIDPDSRDLAEAARRRGAYRLLLRASATAMPFPDGAFATVLSNSVLEHIPDLDGALREIGRVLRPPDPARGEPGGELAITVPSEHFPDFLLGSTMLRRVGLEGAGRAYGRFFNRISRHYHVMPPDAWRERLAAARIAVVEQRYYFSAAAHRRFDLSHYLGVPNLLSKRLIGRWVLFDAQTRYFERWLRPCYEEPFPERGAYLFIRGRKTSA